MTLQYSKKTMQHFLKPKNMGIIKNPDGVGKVGNPQCGDIMNVYIKVNKKNNTIKDIKFKTFGCASAIASSSVTTQLAKGKTLSDAKKITQPQITKALHGLPKIKVHCSSMASEALKLAIKDYEMKKKEIA